MPQLLLLMLLLAATMPAVALGKNTGRPNHAAAWTYETRERSDHGTFSSADRNLIRAWLLEAQRTKPTGRRRPNYRRGCRKRWRAASRCHQAGRKNWPRRTA